MKRLHARRSIVTGRYKACEPSKHNINLFIAGMLLLATLSLHFRGVAQGLMRSAIAAESAVVEVGEWHHNGTPCEKDEDGTVCIVSDTSHPAPIVKPKTAPGKTISFKGKKYSQSQLDVAKTIVKIAKEEDYNQLSLLLAIADCESSFKPDNSNSKGNSPSWSVDRGLFMWNSHWQKDVSNTCAYNMDCSTREAIKDLKAGYASQWMCTAIVKNENRIPFYSELLKTL